MLLLESYLTFCVCHAFWPFYHVTLDEKMSPTLPQHTPYLIRTGSYNGRKYCLQLLGPTTVVLPESCS